MDDVLELDVEENEFDGEISVRTKQSRKDDSQKSTVMPDFDSRDFLSLEEAKQKLLKSLDENDLNNDAMQCSRGSVKSRLGIRHENVEFMDFCDETSEASKTDNTNDFEKKNGRKNSVQRRPNIKNLCRRLHVRLYDNPVKIGKEIAERLEEQKLSLIIETVKMIGAKKTVELFNETKRIQLNGGMRTSNGERRRTSGGVFLTLLKSSNYVTEEQIKQIFKEDISKSKEALKRKKVAYNKRKKLKQEKLLKQQQKDKTKCNDETLIKNENTLKDVSVNGLFDSNSMQIDTKDDDT